MDSEKLIEGLKKSCWGKSAHVVDDERRKAATALSTLQSEKEKLRAELEQVKRERDAAVECVNTVYSYILIKSKTDAVRTIEKWLRGQKED